MSSRRRVLATFVVVTVAATVGLVSRVVACVALASLELMPAVANAGQQVQFRGEYYSDSSDVVLRWGAVDGPEVARVAPAQLVDFGHGYWRAIEGTFTVPGDVAGGAHVVVATQEDSPGKPTWGTPARAALAIVDEHRPGTDAAPLQRSPTSLAPRLASLRSEPANSAPARLVVAGGAAAVISFALLHVVATRRGGKAG